MGRSIETPAERPEVVPRPVSFRHAASSSRFTIRRQGANIEFRHEETGLSANIAAFVGSGLHSRTPVHRKPNGKFAELPLSQYAERGGYWAMSPGFDRADHSGMRRELSDGCIFCHAAYPSSERPLAAIDCQRCHGPGEEHAQSRGAIVNPAKLAPARKLEVCLQCHLETGGRDSPAAIRRVGRKPFSYRPGEPLGDFQLYFAAENPMDAGGIPVNGAGSGLLASVCYQRSGGKLGCTTCHDPHGVRIAAPDAACANCHARPHPENRGSCVTCHMPKRRTHDAVHVVMTDHRIRRQRPSSDPTAPAREKHGVFSGPVLLSYPPVFDPVPEIRAYLGIAAGSAPLLANGLAAMPQPPAAFLFELGRLESSRAERSFRRALAADPHHGGARLALAEWLIARKRPTEASALIEAAPAQDVALMNAHAVALVSEGRVDEAVLILNRAVLADTWDPLTHYNLGVAKLAKGDRDGAARDFQRALQLRPDFTQAREHLHEVRPGAR